MAHAECEHGTDLTLYACEDCNNMNSKYEPTKIEAQVPRTDGPTNAVQAEPPLVEDLRDQFNAAMNRADTMNWLVRAMSTNPPAKHVESELRRLFWSISKEGMR